jgi:hypothetical protein
MRVDRSSPLSRTALWFALLGPPLAWATQLVVGYGVEEADCGKAGAHWSLHVTAWEAALLGLCGVVGAAGLGAAVALWRGSERQEPDPRGRIAFLAVSALLIDGLFLALILLTGIGTVVLDPCDR